MIPSFFAPLRAARRRADLPVATTPPTAGGSPGSTRSESARWQVAEPLEQFLAREGSGNVALVPGFVANNGLSIFGGKAKSFKTQCALQLAMSVASGATFLDRIPERSGPVLYVTEEGNRAGLVQRLAILQGGFCPPAGSVHVLHKAGVVFTESSWMSVTENVNKIQPVLVILDTLASLMDGDENLAQDMRQAIKPLLALTQSGVAVLLLHHVGHGKDHAMPGAKLRGSTFLRGVADSIVIFERGSANGQGSHTVKLTFEAKDWETDPMSVTWDEASGRMSLPPTTGRSDDSRPKRDARVSAAELVAAARGLANGAPVAAQALRSEFPTRARSSFHRDLAEAVTLGAFERSGEGPGTRYLPLPSPP